MGQYVLGGDGSLYQVQGLEMGSSDEPAKDSGAHRGAKDDRELGGYFLGNDGVLYEVVR